MVWGTSLSIPFNWGDVAPASGAPTGVLFWARFVKKCSKLSSKPKQQCHQPRSLRRQYFGPIWWEKLNLATSRHFKRWPWVIENGPFWPCFLGPKTRLRFYDFKLIQDPPRIDWPEWPCPRKILMPATIKDILIYYINCVCLISVNINILVKV